MAMVAPTSLITPIGIARRSSLSRSLRKNFLSLWSDQVNRPIPQRTGACLPAEDLYSSQMIDSFLNRSRQIFLLIDHCKPFYASLPLCALNPKERRKAGSGAPVILFFRLSSFIHKCLLLYLYTFPTRIEILFFPFWLIDDRTPILQLILVWMPLRIQVLQFGNFYITYLWNSQKSILLIRRKKERIIQMLLLWTRKDHDPLFR